MLQSIKPAEIGMTFVEKVRAHIKGDVFGKPINEREYYYLMFGCINSKQIAAVKKLYEDLEDAIDWKDTIESNRIYEEIKKYRAGKGVYDE